MEVQAVQPGSEAASETAALESKETLTVSEAARLLGSQRNKRDEEIQAPAAPAEAAAEPAQSEAKADDAAPPQEVPGETQESEPAETPLIEAPRSWTKDEKDRFATLPRETQEYIASREQDRERTIRQSQNEAAEQRKAIDAETQKLGQLRQQYEANLPLVTQAIQAAIINEFPDIKTAEDVKNLAVNDPARYVQWDAKTKQFGQWQAELQNAQQRQQQEASEQLQKWTKSQDEEIEKEFEKVPESERKTLANEAKSMLLEYGMPEADLGNLWERSILRSAPLQRVMADAARYRLAKRTAAKPAPKPVPAVQRPGVAQPKGADDSVQALKEAFERNPTVKNGAALQRAERAARAA